ncbi:MAG: alginate export family protein [Gemmataceae bacterium]
MTLRLPRYFPLLFLSLTGLLFADAVAFAQPGEVSPSFMTIQTLSPEGTATAREMPSSEGMTIFDKTFTGKGTKKEKKESSTREVISSKIVDCEKCEESNKEKKADECKSKGQLSMLPVRPLPPPGNAPVLPGGAGYYSFWDFVNGNVRKAPPKRPYAPTGLILKSFYDSDFRYLDSPKNKQFNVFDPLHQIYLGQNWYFSTGGDVRWRSMNERNARLSGITDNHDLFRVRAYGDLWYKDTFRIFGEFIYAESVNQDLNPRPIDINRSDILNLFIDYKVGTVADAPVYVRGGRQELLFGSQRLISPVEWTNTRRTFQGVRVFRPGKKLDVDLFWVQPVIPNRNELDSVDNDRNFAGAWVTYRPKKGHIIDSYYLFLDDVTPVPILDIGSAPTTTHTIGARYFGTKDNFRWDFEGMLQFGDRGDQSVFAGAASAGVGYNFKNLPLNPTFWVYYDYASGDDPTDGDFSTFNQLFPFGHYYLGWIDLVGRQNIHDVNAHLFLYPTRWMTVWLQYHHFELANSRDALFNAGGLSIRRDPTGMSGTDVGEELDIVVNLHVGDRSDILLGYSRLFEGGFLRNQGVSETPDFFFVQFSQRW